MPEVHTKEALLEKANRLPRSPGVYIMKNRSGTVIYVGKSKGLKNRVSQYFHSEKDHNEKTRRMVSQVADFSYILTDTEMEALTLENSLIKHHSPKYNIRLKDDKNYPYIRISMDEPYPKIKMVRKRGGDKGKYYGPYSGSQTVWQLIGAIQKIFGVARCKMDFPKDIGKQRPCLYAQMGGCMAPCTGKISSEEYKAVFAQIATLLRGDTAEVKRTLHEEMEMASEQLAFEKAAQLRDKLQLISHIWEKQKVVSAPDTQQDIFAYTTTPTCTCISVFYVRGGILIDHEHLIFGADQLFEEENIPQFLLSFYQKREFIPKEILLDFDLPDEEIQSLSAYFAAQNDCKVTIRVPKRGNSKQLCDMAKQNATEYAKQYEIDSAKDNAALVKLASLLHLEVVPQRIESYDISNYATEHVTAGMVVMENGKFSKKDYRMFHIRSVTRDDYAAMAEAVERRFTHYLAGDAGFDTAPDLLLLDGGVGHVHTICEVLQRLNLTIPVFGMVKDDYHKTRVLTDGENEINIAKEQSVFVMLYQLQEEVHRYTINRMKGAKNKTMRSSSLEKIPGIGPAKAKALLSHFVSLAAIKDADAAALCKVSGITPEIANHIITYFQKSNGDTNI